MNGKVIPYPIKDFSGGWNDVGNEWSMPANEAATIKDFDLKYKSLACRDYLTACSSEVYPGVANLKYFYAITDTVVWGEGDPQDKILLTGSLVGAYGDTSLYGSIYSLSYDKCDEQRPRLTSFNSVRINAFYHSKLPVYHCFYEGNMIFSNGYNGWLYNETGVYNAINSGYIGKYIVNFDNRLWIFNTFLGGQHCWVTDFYDLPNAVASFSDNGESFTIGDSRPITGAIVFLGNLYVFKENQIWIVRPDITNEVLIDGIGAVDQKTIVPIFNSLFFLDRNGVYSWRGGQDTPTLISGKIENYIRDCYTERPFKDGWWNLGSEETNWYQLEPFNLLTTNDDNELCLSGSEVEGYTTGAVQIDHTSAYQLPGRIFVEFATDDTEGDSHIAIMVSYRWFKWVSPSWVADGSGDLEFLDVYKPYASLQVPYPNSWSSADEGTTFRLSIDRVYLYRTFAIYDSPTLSRIYYQRPEIKRNNASTPLSLHKVLPFAFNYDNKYHLSLSNNHTNSTREPYNENLAILGVPTGNEQAAWWRHKDLSYTYGGNTQRPMMGNAFYYKKRLFIANHENADPRSYLRSYYFGDDLLGDDMQQKYTSPYFDFGMPDNDKEFRKTSIDIYVKHPGKLYITWRVMYSDERGDGTESKRIEIDLTTTPSNITKNIIIDHYSPTESGASYGKKIQYEISGFHNMAFDLLRITPYIKTMIEKASEGESADT